MLDGLTLAEQLIIIMGSIAVVILAGGAVIAIWTVIKYKPGDYEKIIKRHHRPSTPPPSQQERAE